MICIHWFLRTLLHKGRLFFDSALKLGHFQLTKNEVEIPIFEVVFFCVNHAVGFVSRNHFVVYNPAGCEKNGSVVEHVASFLFARA